MYSQKFILGWFSKDPRHPDYVSFPFHNQGTPPSELAKIGKGPEKEK